MVKKDDKKKHVDPEEPPAEPPPPPKQVSKPADPVAATGAKTGFDPMRPFRYAWGFVSGTVSYGLDGISSGVRKGMVFGALGCVGFAFLTVLMPALSVPLLAGISGNIITAAVVGGVGGGLIGGVIGGVLGFATGGTKGVTRIMRGEKYAEDLLEKQKSKNAHRGANGPDYRDYYKAHQERNADNFDRVRQIQMENNRDTRTYWQDRVGGDRGAMGGFGQGF